MMALHLQPDRRKSSKRLMRIQPKGTLNSSENTFIIRQYQNENHLILFTIRFKHSYFVMEFGGNLDPIASPVNGTVNSYEIAILSFAELLRTTETDDVLFSSKEGEQNFHSSSEHSTYGSSNGYSLYEVNEPEISPLSPDLQLLNNVHYPVDEAEEAQISQSSGSESSEPPTSNESGLTPSQLEDLAMLDALIDDPSSAVDTQTVNSIIDELVPAPLHISDEDCFSNDLSYELELFMNNVYDNCLSQNNFNISHSPCTVFVENNLSDQSGTRKFSSQQSTLNETVVPSQDVPRSDTNQYKSRTIGLLIRVDVPSQTRKIRSILPGPPVPKTVAISGKERLLQRLNPVKAIEAKAKVAVLPEGELVRGNEDGDNHLMILVSKPHKNLLELVYALVERMRLVPGALEASNSCGESALYIASVSLPEEPVVARYLAETLLDMDINIAELTFENGQSLAHCVSERGDSHRHVLAELLSLKDPDTNQPIFNLNKPSDRSGHTPLHVAACSHGKHNVCSIATVRLLVKQGANLLEQMNSSRSYKEDYIKQLPTSEMMQLFKDLTRQLTGGKDWQAGFSVLHIAVREACDPPLVLAILEEARNTSGGPEVAANQVTYNGDTPLHLVAVNDQVCIKKQCETFRLLVYHGAQRGKRNRRGKVALALVAKARKEMLNRLRSGVGRSKTNMKKWGLSHESTLCVCGEEQTMVHLLNCNSCPLVCTMQDLVKATPNGRDLAKYWSNIV